MPIPTECQAVADEFEELKQERDGLQAELQTAPTGMKAGLAHQIKRLNALIGAKQTALDGCVAQYGDDTQPLASSFTGAIKLRIVCYNIAEGNRYNLPANSNLPALADQIRGKSPDIVLLNEARIDNEWPFGSGVNQFKMLSNLTGLAYYGSGNTTSTGLTGHKAVGILSRFPLLTQRVIPVMRGSSPTKYATFEATVEIAGSIHHIFATRFDAWHPEDREAGIRQAAAIIQTIDVSRPVIFGGDFNCGPSQADFDIFPRDSGLKPVFAERPDPHFGGLDHIDHIFYRGPYRVTQVEHRCVIEVPNNPNNRECDDASDHPSVFVELATPVDDSMAIYKSRIKLKHLRTAGTLHSHLHNYGHPASSGQQQVTAFGGADGNDVWRLHGPHDSPREYGENQPICDGDVVRLEHVATGCNLHSHDGHPSPVTGQQEVTCFGQNGIGDENDNWRVEVEGGGIWTFDKRVKLIHVPTNHALHSHAGFAHPQWTMGQQEVTCFADRDDNDWWYLTEVN